MEEVPLSEDEERSWSGLVAEGREIRAPAVAAKEAKRAANRAAMLAGRGRDPGEVFKGGRVRNDPPVPDRVRRWVVSRAAGLSFKAAGEASGASWNDVMEAKRTNEEFRCAYFAQEERSRELMRAKAISVIEQSQEEDSKVSMAKTQVSMMLLRSLDRAHFGEAVPASIVEAASSGKGGGGFVIRMVTDAVKVSEEAPSERPRKAIVYSDV